MKKKQLTEAKNKSVTELKKDLIEAKRQLTKLRLEIAAGKIKNKRVGKSLRKDIAQIETICEEKQTKKLEVA